MADYQSYKEHNTPGTGTPEEPARKWKKGGCALIALNIALIMAAGVLLLWGTMGFLKLYTRWGDAVTVPEVAGLSRAEAEEAFRKLDLRMEIIDSVFVDSAKPGVVMDTNPRQGSKVKSNRVIFVTVNANSARQIALPQVLQLSKRQAIATLRGAGFTNVIERFVPGEFNDLVLAVKDGATGLALISGNRLAVNTPIVLEVSSAPLLDSLMMVEDALLRDSLAKSSGGAAPERGSEPTTGPDTGNGGNTTQSDPDDWF